MEGAQINNLPIKYNKVKVYVNRAITFHLSPIIHKFMKENPSLIYQIKSSYNNSFLPLFIDIFTGKQFQISTKNFQFLIDLFQDLQVTKFDFLLDKMQNQILNTIDLSSEFQNLTLFYNLVQNLNDINFLDTVSKCEKLINIKIDISSVANVLFNFFISRPENIDLYLNFTLNFKNILIKNLKTQLRLLLSTSSSCDVIYIAAKFIEYQIIDSKEILFILKVNQNEFNLNLLSFILSPRKHNFRLKNQNDLKTLCLKGESQNQLLKIIREDNLSEFQLLASGPNFDINNTNFFTYKELYFEKIRMLHKKNITCIEIAALFGSLQIFKFLLMSNAYITDRLTKFAVAGGNSEIVHLCDQKNLNFSQCLKYALKYGHDELFDWLIDSKRCQLFTEDTINANDRISAFLVNSFFTVLPSPNIFQSILRRFYNDEILSIFVASVHRGFYTYFSIIANIINCLSTDNSFAHCNLYSAALKSGSSETYRLIRSNKELRYFMNSISLKKNVNYSYNFYTTENNLYNLHIYNMNNELKNDNNDDDEDDKMKNLPVYLAPEIDNIDLIKEKERDDDIKHSDNDNDNDNIISYDPNNNNNDINNDNSYEDTTMQNDINNNDNDNNNNNTNNYNNSNDMNSNENQDTNNNNEDHFNVNNYFDILNNFEEEEEEEEIGIEEEEFGIPENNITINDYTDLHIACFAGNAEAVDDIIYENFDKNLNKLVNSYIVNPPHNIRLPDHRYNCTPLHAACMSESVDSVLLLLATNECNLDALADKNMTPLHSAVLRDSVEIFQMIYNFPGIEKKPLMYHQKLPFHLAAKSGSLNVLKFIAEKTDNFDVNEKAAQGMTALHYACKYNQKEIVSYLLKIPTCDINSKTDEDLLTAFHFACKYCDIEIIKLLAERKDLKINERNINDEPPLLFAIRSKFVEAVSFLINLEGIDLSAPKLMLEACYTPEQLMEESTDLINAELVKILLTKKEINVNCREKDTKMTPLHFAALNNHFETVKALLNSEKIIPNPHDILFWEFFIISHILIFNRFRFLIFMVDPA